MKRFGLVLIFSSILIFSYAQEKIVLDSIPKNKKEFDRLQLSMDKSLLFDDMFSLGKISLFQPYSFNQHLLPDYSKNLDFKNLLSTSRITTESYYSYEYGFYPFLLNGSIFNQASYRISDRFILGGNSFGAQSIQEQPRINSSIQNMSTKGISMYMKYNVSKNFKVETRINIYNHQSPGIP